MAVTATLKQHKVKGNGYSGADISESLTAFTPAADSLLVVLLGLNDSTGDQDAAATVVCAGGGLTWTRQTFADISSNFKCRSVVFTAPVGGSPVSTTITLSGAKAGVWSVAAYECTGQHATPVGGKIATADQVGDGSLTITLDATPASDSVVLALVHVSCDNNGTNLVTHGSGWTEDSDIDGSVDFAHSQVQQRTGSTSTSVTWDDVQAGTATTDSSSAVAIEIKAAAGGGPSMPVMFHHHARNWRKG